MRWPRLGVIALILLLVVAARFTRHDEESDAPVAAPAATSASPTATVSPLASPSLPASPTPSASDAAAVRAAQAWVAAWLNTRGGQKPWLARLQPITDGTLWDSLALPGVVDAVPRGTVRPGARAAGQVQGSTEVTVPTTAGTMLVVMTPRNGGWVTIANDRAPE